MIQGEEQADLEKVDIVSEEPVDFRDTEPLCFDIQEGCINNIQGENLEDTIVEDFGNDGK